VIAGANFLAEKNGIVLVHFKGKRYRARVKRICTQEEYEAQLPGLDGSCWEHFYEVFVD